MNLVDKKDLLFQAVINADEEFTDQLINFIKQYKHVPKFSDEELAEFHRRRDAYLKNPENVYTMEEVLDRLRSKLKK